MKSCDLPDRESLVGRYVRSRSGSVCRLDQYYATEQGYRYIHLQSRAAGYTSHNSLSLWYDMLTDEEVTWYLLAEK